LQAASHVVKKNIIYGFQSFANLNRYINN